MRRMAPLPITPADLPHLARIPDTIADLARAYAASGGDTADLAQVLSPEQVTALHD